MSKPNIWIFSLEPLDSRYTQQWYTAIPNAIAKAAGDDFNVVQVNGVQNTAKVTNGAFLNFSDTNYWKSSQLCNFVDLFNSGKTTVNDRFLFTDTWNPCITQIAYMRDLMDQNWELHGIWHAGAYDPSDILGYKMQKPWPWDAERSWFYSCDYNYYATDFHRNMFIKNLDIHPDHWYRAETAGQPHYEIVNSLSKYSDPVKSDDNIVMWPHRYNQDKQPEIAHDLESAFNVIITQKHSFSKTEYYDKLSQSRVIFSCSLHENLGLSVAEGALVGAIPVVPDRCSYKEMYLDEFKYPSEWTENYQAYLDNKSNLVDFINDKIVNYEAHKPLLAKQRDILINNYLTAPKMIKLLTRTV